MKTILSKNAKNTHGGVVYSYIKLNVGSDLIRNLGCNDLTADKKFTLLLLSDKNMLLYFDPKSGLSVAVKIKTDVGFLS